MCKKKKAWSIQRHPHKFYLKKKNIFLKLFNKMLEKMCSGNGYQNSMKNKIISF